MTSRAHARSEEELNRLLRRSIELVVSVVAPVSLLISLGADVIVVTAFGEGYRPAVLSLRVIAPMFVLTYVAMIGSSALVRLGRDWTVTAVALGGMLLNPSLNWVLIPLLLGRLGPGGAGVAAAVSLLATELMITTVTLARLGGRAMDGRTASTLLRAAAVCAIVCVFHHAGGLQGWLRLAVDAALYVVVGLGVGALRAQEVLQAVGLAWKQKAVEPEIEIG
jgi:O-antigen/teichoic acid export membrane protein